MRFDKFLIENNFSRLPKIYLAYLLIFKINDYMMYKVQLAELRTEYEGKISKLFLGRIRSVQSIVHDTNQPVDREGNLIREILLGYYDIYIDGFNNYSYNYIKVKGDLSKSHPCYLLVMKIISGRYSLSQFQHLFE